MSFRLVPILMNAVAYYPRDIFLESAYYDAIIVRFEVTHCCVYIHCYNQAKLPVTENYGSGLWVRKCKAPPALRRQSE